MEIDFSKTFLNKQVSRNAISMLVWSFTIFMIVLVLGVAVGRNVSSGIRKSVEVMKDIAKGEGDLTSRIKVGSKDEIGELQNWINQFMDKIHELVEQVKGNADRVAFTASEIGEIAFRLTQITQEQKTKSAEVFSSIEHTAEAIIRNAKNAEQTAGMAGDAEAMAKNGTEAVENTRKSMDSIVRGVSQMGKVVHSLAARLKEIETVVEIIDDIARMTNLLSVNAHIEAVHSGETGPGIMAVAEEIRGLADRTRFSTQKIGEILAAIQVEIGNVLELIKANQETIDAGKKTSNETAKSLGRIIAMADNAMQMVRQIAEDSKAESTDARGISIEVEAIGEITRETAEGVAKMAKTIQDLNVQTETLRNAISRFRL